MPSNRSFANAVKWAYAGNWGERTLSSLSTFILAALLEPQDFGVVAIAMVYVTFLQLFLDQGFRAALIQRKDLEPQHLDAVFWMDVLWSLLLVGVSVLISGWSAARKPVLRKTRRETDLSVLLAMHSHRRLWPWMQGGEPGAGRWTSRCFQSAQLLPQSSAA